MTTTHLLYTFDSLENPKGPLNTRLGPVGPGAQANVWDPQASRGARESHHFNCREDPILTIVVLCSDLMCHNGIKVLNLDENINFEASNKHQRNYIHIRGVDASWEELLPGSFPLFQC